MYFKVKILVILLCTTLCFCKKSFSIVTDITFSMKEEIDSIKRNIGEVFNSIDSTEVDDFILITFKDPDVGPPQTFSSRVDFESRLNQLHVSGVEWANDCPENALAAIEKALQVSKPDSQIFVFTDAYANDTSKLPNVQNLCLTTRSQVIVILSGRCVPSGITQEGSIDVYFDVARSCKGGIFQIDFNNNNMNMKQAFNIMKEIMKTEWTQIKTQDVIYNRDITISVDSATTHLMITAYGNCHSMKIFDNAGNAVNVTERVHTPNVTIVRFTELVPGNYRVSFNCQGRTSTTVYKRNDLPVKIGFSLFYTNFLKLTSSRPIPGWDNYIYLLLPLDTTIKLHTLIVYNINKNETTTYSLEENNQYKGQYSTSDLRLVYFFDHDTSFQITVLGHDTASTLDVTKTTKILKTQKSLWSRRVKEVPETKPQVELLTKTTSVDYESTPVIVCKVTGYPKPEISWQVGDENLTSQIFTIQIPNIVASYAEIQNIKNNATVHCNAKNSKGEDERSLDLFVIRKFSFEEIEIPQDATIDYGADGRLECKIDAYPEVTISWYHNDTLLNSYGLRPNIEIASENQELLIKNMTLDDIGVYKCEVKNDVETRSYTAKVDISGIEAPQIELEQTEVHLKPGDRTEFDCIAKGQPLPNISWKYKSPNEDYFNTIPDEIELEDGKLRIISAKTEDSGIYRCEASNILGLDYQEVTVRIQYAPTISSNMPNKLTVNEGNTVKLNCAVDAVPEATVTWEIIKDGVTMPFEDRHTIENDHTLRFLALETDSGDYRCIAENEVGRDEKTVQITVSVEVYIQAPQMKNMTVRAGSSITLPCYIKYGNPPPSTKWEFKRLGTTRTLVAFRGNSTINNLHLSNISKENEGSYSCIADNGITSDNIKIYLKVQ